jgi:hypothetical protein
MVGDIWGMDDANLLVVRATKAVSIGTSIIDNSGSARCGTSTSTGDSDRHREAQRHNRQTHSYRR